MCILERYGPVSISIYLPPPFSEKKRKEKATFFLFQDSDDFGKTFETINF